MKYSEFVKIIPDSKIDICRAAFLEHKEKIQIKKEAVVIKNLEKIFDTTLKIGISKGFQAMTMRDLSSGSGLSMGALYSYFSSKDEILTVYLGQGRKIIKQVFEEFLIKEKTPLEKLEIVIEVHLFLTEKMHQWFYFSYMEAKNLNPEEMERSVQSELYTEKIIADILVEGYEKGVFKPGDHTLGASVIKSMLQDWYLKRGKYSRRKIDVDQYAQFLLTFIKSFYLV